MQWRVDDGCVQTAKTVVEAELEGSLLRANQQLVEALNQARQLAAAGPITAPAAAERVSDAFDAVR